MAGAHREAGPFVDRTAARGRTSDDPVRPTEREMAALVMLAWVADHHEAARRLGVSISAYQDRLARLYPKLGVFNAIGAFRALGWLEVPE